MSPAPIEFPVEGLTDGVVTVRMIAEQDVQAIVDACADPEIPRFTTIPSPYDESHAKGWMSRSAARLAAGTDVAAVITDARSGEVLGGVGLHNLDPASGRCSAGYWVAAPARARGVARRALSLLCGYGFEELGVQRIELWIEPANPASLRVAEAVGFVREGLLRSFMAIGGRRRDMLMYSLLPGESR